jgi:AraC family transcriptional regulator of adaptative response/methylated-DNA-[protein]-cysteine methyltransferase
MVAQEETQTDTDEFWQAVANRDPDAAFVYAVRSTGIYCRPSCPSRRPRRDRVLFFARATAAAQAGFRACRRCAPDRSSDPQVELVQAACRAIDEAVDGKVTLVDLGKRVGSSPYHLQRTFKRIMGISPRQYADSRRLERLRNRLHAGEPVTAAVYDAGYGSSSRVYERAGSQLGMPPAVYGRGGRGMRVRYATAACPLGRLLVAATERGICFVSLGDSDLELETVLWRQYGEAEIERDPGPLDQWVEAILRYLAGQEPHLDLPTDVRATAFQRRVWEELRAIPYGETRSYGEIARALGKPDAVRAVGHACAINPTAIVVPCHRVVRGDGNLAGYRWGIERKRMLLAAERAQGSEDESLSGA